MILLIKMENQDFELVFISESDTDNVSDIKSNDDSDTDIASEIMSEKKRTC